MRHPALIPASPAERARANLDDYVRARHDFSWARVRAELAEHPAGRLANIGYQAVDRHASTDDRYRVALRCVGPRGSSHHLTYGYLAQATSRFANLLDRSGIRPGDRVFVLLPECAPGYVAVLGTLRGTAVLATLPVARAAEAGHCLALSEATVLVTTPELYETHVAPLRGFLGTLRQVFLTGDDSAIPGTTNLETALDAMPTTFAVPPIDPRDPALVHFTAGTKGRVSGVVHPHEAVLGHFVSARYALDLHRDDVLRASVPAGRITHTVHGIIAPLVHGVTTVVMANGREPAGLPPAEPVTVWYAASDLLERIAGGARPWPSPPPALRLIVAEGGSLTPETVLRTRDRLGRAAHDTWWQTETGAIMIGNLAGLGARPGSMGLPMPGVRATVVERLPGGHVRPVEAPDEAGELALRAGWPSMFRYHLADPDRSAACFADGWYLTGDRVRRDADGYFWFAGRTS